LHSQLPKNSEVWSFDQVPRFRRNRSKLNRMIDVAMSEEQFAAASRRFATNGIELTGNSGTLTKDGITAKYDYVDGHLKIEVLDRPFFLPLSMIEGRLEHYLEQSMATASRPEAS
jgi:hypothetical protein